MSSLDPTLFPGVSSSVECHNGFADEQAKYISLNHLEQGIPNLVFRRTATTILAAVRTTIAAHAATKVTIVGHSLGAKGHPILEFPLINLICVLGAAIALLDGVYLPLHISGVSFKVIGYGMPRVCTRLPHSRSFKLIGGSNQVGNQAFADYVDAHLSLTHINNR